MKKKRQLLLFFLSCFTILQAQEKQITVETNSEILWAGVDRASDLLILLKSGEVQKLNKEGKK